MKKICLALGLMVVSGISVRAQIGRGGIPESMQNHNVQQYVPVHTSVLPDWESFKQKEKSDIAAGISKPLMVALFTPTDIGFPSSGAIVTLDNGKRIWRSRLKIENAPAVGFYYDQFHLPEGVKYFITNENGAQILGAFTTDNNATSGLFASEAVQGGIVNLEMDIEPGVNLDDIDFHIDRSAVYFRSYEHLNQYGDIRNLTATAVDSALNGLSSVCMINAICPLGNGYATQRKAVAQELFVETGGVGVCTGTMVNNTGNTTSSCKQYLLTASHCNPASDTVSAKFDQTIVRFNFEKAQCTGGVIPEGQTMTGVNFVARGVYAAATPQQIKGDFLLFELRQMVPANWNVVLAGWNKNAGIPLTTTAPKKFIGFHHPSGDNKKVSSSHQLESTALGAPDSHWGTQLDSGYAAQGSSGSGLFDGDGRLIGILSAGGPNQVPASCNVSVKGEAIDAMNVLLYSKFSYDWDYTVDGNNPKRKLKPWLDPANTGVVTINPVKSNCTALDGTGTAIRNVDDELGSAISIYPNPNTSGKVSAMINLPEVTNLTAEVFDVTGKKQQSIQLNHVKSGVFNFDLSSYANGMYIINFSNGSATAAKKVMLSR